MFDIMLPGHGDTINMPTCASLLLWIQ